jgi:periplasmic copper chaperone A
MLMISEDTHRFKDIQMNQLLKLFLVGLLLPTISQSAQCHEKSSEASKTGIIITAPWARAGKPNSAAFMKLKNTHSQDRRLISAKADCAERVELHDHLQEGDVMKMRQVESILIPAGGEVELMPGGKHVMLFGLGDGLLSGEVFWLTLTYDNGHEDKLEVPVKPMTYNAKLNHDCGCNR